MASALALTGVSDGFADCEAHEAAARTRHESENMWRRVIGFCEAGNVDCSAKTIV